MIYRGCIFTVLYAVFSVKANLQQLNSFQNNSKRQSSAVLTVRNRSAELECCEKVVHDYYFSKRKPHIGYLSTFLASLQAWKCPQFQQECERPTFNYTDFTSLLYLRFCNRSLMEAKCYDDILRIVTKQSSGVQITTNKYNQLVSKLNLLTMSEEDLMNPCVQVAMYDRDSGRKNHYHEMMEPFVPFCSFVWCGFDEKVFTKKNVTPWTCLPSRCRLNLVLYSVIKAFLALAIVACNATILGVLSSKTQEVKNIYRLSLAVADFIMGVFVIPISVGTMYQNLMQSPTFTELKNVTSYGLVNESSSLMQPVALNLKELDDRLPLKFSNSYASAVGFFTVLSLSVSVCSMVAASFDRFVAINRPLRYNKLKAISAGKIGIILVWFVGFVFAIFPVVIPDLSNIFVLSNLEAYGGKPMLVVYAIAFFLTVVLMWSSVIATCVVARPSLRNRNRQQQTDDEMRFFLTLGIMIAVFTLCVVPNGLILIVSAYLHYTDLKNPKNFDAVAAMQLTSAEASVAMLLYSNSLWNCFIYSFRETTFRNAAKLLYKRIVQCLKLDQAWNLVSRKN